MNNIFGSLCTLLENYDSFKVTPTNETTTKAQTIGINLITTDSDARHMSQGLQDISDDVAVGTGYVYSDGKMYLNQLNNLCVDVTIVNFFSKLNLSEEERMMLCLALDLEADSSDDIVAEITDYQFFNKVVPGLNAIKVSYKDKFFNVATNHLTDVSLKLVIDEKNKEVEQIVKEYNLDNIEYPTIFKQNVRMSTLYYAICVYIYAEKKIKVLQKLPVNDQNYYVRKINNRIDTIVSLIGGNEIKLQGDNIITETGSLNISQKNIAKIKVVVKASGGIVDSSESSEKEDNQNVVQDPEVSENDDVIVKKDEVIRKDNTQQIKIILIIVISGVILFVLLLFVGLIKKAASIEPEVEYIINGVKF